MMRKYKAIIERLAVDSAYDALVWSYHKKREQKNNTVDIAPIRSICENNVRALPYNELEPSEKLSLGDIYNVIDDLVRDVYSIVNDDNIQNDAVARFIGYMRLEKTRNTPIWETDSFDVAALLDKAEEHANRKLKEILKINEKDTTDA